MPYLWYLIYDILLGKTMKVIKNIYINFSIEKTLFFKVLVDKKNNNCNRTWLLMRAIKTFSNSSDMTTKPLMARSKFSIDLCILINSLLYLSTSWRRTIVRDGSLPAESLYKYFVIIFIL